VKPLKKQVGNIVNFWREGAGKNNCFEIFPENWKRHRWIIIFLLSLLLLISSLETRCLTSGLILFIRQRKFVVTRRHVSNNEARIVGADPKRTSRNRYRFSDPKRIAGFMSSEHVERCRELNPVNTFSESANHCNRAHHSRQRSGAESREYEITADPCRELKEFKSMRSINEL